MAPESGLHWAPPCLRLHLKVRGAEAAKLVRLARLPNWLIRNGELERWTWDFHNEEEGFLVWHKNLDSAFWEFRPWSEFLEVWDWSGLNNILEILIVLAVNKELPNQVRPTLIFGDLEKRALGLNRLFLDRLHQVLPEQSMDYGTPPGSHRPWSAWLGSRVIAFLGRTTTSPIQDIELGWEERTFGLRQDFAALVIDSQVPGKEPELGQWRKLFLENPEGPPLRNVNSREIELHQKSRDRQRRLAPLKNKIQEVRRFIRSNFQALGLIALVAGVLILPELCVIGRGSTSNSVPMSDEDAIFGYYEAINGLRASDLRLLSQSPESRQDAWEVGQLYVFRETRKATLGDEGLISLTDWRRQGEPLLGEGLTVYGIDLVLVQRLEAGIFEVTYHRARWDRDKIQAKPVLENVVDRIRLDRQGGSTRLVFLKREVRPL